MSLHENPSPPLFQPDSPPPPMGRPDNPFESFSILDIPHHARPDWTTFLTEPIPTRILAASYSSLKPDTSGCIEAMEIRICSGPSGTSYSPSTSQSVVTVPPEATMKTTVGGGQPSTMMATSPSPSTQNPYYNPAQGSMNQPQGPTTTLQTLSSTSTSPSPSILPSQSTLTTDTTALPSQTTTTTDLSGQSETLQPNQQGPIAVYIILGVFVIFGLVCAIVTNRRFVTWTQAAIRKRNENIERLDRAKRAEMIEAAKSAQKVER